MKKLLSFLLSAVFFVISFTACQPIKTDVESETESTSEKIVPRNIIINEAMADNEKLVMGHGFDWVELYFRDEGTVDLGHYALTDNLEDPQAIYSLKGMTIRDGEYLVITLDDKAPFHLSAQGETVYLTFDGEVISELAYTESANGESFSADGVCEYPTPGYSNNKEGYRDYLNSVKLPELIITEVLPTNSSFLAVGGKYYDIVEVMNNSDKAIDLSQYTLTDKQKEPERYRFPKVSLRPGEFFVVYCSGQTSLGENHTSFKISANGEDVYLAKDKQLCDMITVPSDVAKNESYGRTGNKLLYYSKPTPGDKNADGYDNTAMSAPKASVQSGLYDKALSVELEGNGKIYYTVNGLRPTEKSAVYAEPIKIDKTTTIRTYATDGKHTSALTAYTYVIGAKHELPVVSVAIPQGYLTHKDKGILNHIDKTYEYESQLTLIEKGKEEFSVPCGFRLHGNDSRKGAKQNFQLRFRSEYGAGKLKYKLFENRDFDEFNSLLLKGGSEDWNNAVLRDELATKMVDGTTALYAQAIKPVVLYLGGEYWGIYYIRERYSDDYVASHMNVSEDSVDIGYSNDGYAQAGSTKDLTELKNYVRSHDMTKAESYKYLTDRIDVNSLMDWYICRSYVGDKDLANIRRFRTSEGDGKWRWMYFDLDWSFTITNDNPLSGIVNNIGGETVLINALLKNKKGRDLFLKRYAELMDKVLNDKNINEVLDSIIKEIESEIPRDRERWGRSVSGWNDAIQRIRNYTKDGVRDKRVKADLKAYFKLTDAQMKAYFG